MTFKMMLVDASLCHDCNNCFLACRDEHCGVAREGYFAPQPRHGHRWIDILCRERGVYPMIDVSFLPVMCQQCNVPPCAEAAEGAVRIREDGIVVIDPVLARGMESLAESCPYGAIWWNEEEQLPQKCDFCAHLVDEGGIPRCVEVCPTGALRWLELDEDDEETVFALFDEGWKPYRAELGTHPNVLYRGLDSFEKQLYCGKVVVDGDCVAGLEVTLARGGETLARTVTNAFGEYRFDGLDKGSYEIIINGKPHRIEL